MTREPMHETNDTTPAELRPLERLLDHDAECRRGEPDRGFEARVLDAALGEMVPAPIRIEAHPAARRTWGSVLGWGGAAIAAGVAGFLAVPMLLSPPAQPSAPMTAATLEEDVVVLLALTETDADWEAELLSVLADTDALLSDEGDLAELFGEGAI